MKRLVCLLCVLMCIFSSCHAARKVYPAFNGTVCDDAAVLSQQTIEDIEALNAQLAPCRVHIYTCHFLGGEDVKQYTEELFNQLYFYDISSDFLWHGCDGVLFGDRCLCDICADRLNGTCAVL